VHTGFDEFLSESSRHGEIRFLLMAGKSVHQPGVSRLPSGSARSRQYRTISAIFGGCQRNVGRVPVDPSLIRQTPRPLSPAA